MTETTILNHAIFSGDSVTIHVKTAHLSELVTCDPVFLIDTYRTVQTPVFPIPVQNNITDNFDNDSVNNDDYDNDSDSQFNFLKKLKDGARKRDIDHVAHFRNKVLNKLKTDTRSRASKSSAAKFLVESFGNSLDDYNFVCWLAKQLELKPCRLKKLSKRHTENLLHRIQCLHLPYKLHITFG